MKLKLILTTLLALVAITIAHVALNVQGGWRTVWEELTTSRDRRTLEVGFLPVT